jgi:hypothetical protein
VASFSEFSPPLHQIKTTLSPIILAIAIAISGIIDLDSSPLERSEDPVRTTDLITPADDSRQEP